MNEITGEGTLGFSMSLCVSRAVATLLLLVVWALSDVAWAQVTTHITPTTTAPLDLGTEVDTVGTTIHIMGGTRPEGGTNLFHSFDFFTVGTSDIALFQNDMMLPTTNIIARVIGDAAGLRQASTIDGILRTNNPLNALDPLNFGAANLYLVNPAGIIFGPHAQLDLKGSFAATTADYLRMTDGAQFHTEPVQQSVLSVADVASFGFTNPQPVAITIDRSILIASPGQTLSFIGGDFSVIGDPGPGFPFIGMFGGQVNIAAVGSLGEVIPNNPGSPIDLNVDSFASLGNISMQEVQVGVNGFDQNVNPGGNIVIRGGDMIFSDNMSLNARGAPGGQVSIEGSSLQMLRGSLVSTTTRGSVNHPGDAVNIQLTGDFILTDGEIASSNVGLGKAGDIRISAANMYFGPDNPNQTFFANFRGDIGSRSFGPGRTGDVEISTPGNLLVMNGFFFGTRALSTGNGGNTTVRVGDLEVRDGASIDSASLNPPNVISAGNAGILDITADNILLSARNTQIANNTGLFTQTQGTGAGGLLRINTETLRVLDGAIVNSGVLNGANVGGAIEITATDIIVSGTGVGADTSTFPGTLLPNTPASIASSVSGPLGTGTGGVIQINTESLTVTDRGFISSSVVQGASGSAGGVEIITESLDITNRGLIAAAAVNGTGNAGNIDIAANDVRIAGVAGTADPFGFDATGIATSTNAGRGGALMLNADTLVVADNGVITSRTIGTGNAGTVDLQIATSLSLATGGIVSASTSGSGVGGNVAVTTPTLSLNGSIIEAKTSSTGNAGPITLNTNIVSLFNAAQVTSSSVGTATGRAGNITVQGLNGAGTSAQSISLTGASTSITSDTDNTGRGGDIQIRAGQVQLADLASLTATTSGTGRAGSIGVMSNNFSVTGGARIEASTQGVGNAGDITITNTDTVSVTGMSSNGSTRSGIFAKTQTSGGTAGAGTGGGSGGSGSGGGGGGSSGGSSGGGSGGGQASTSGNAGNIGITTNNLLLSGGAQIDSSTTTSGSGGHVSVIADDITITGTSTSLKSDASRGNGTGGNIVLAARTIGIHDKASLNAATDGSGNAGNISMTANESVTLDSAAIITTSTRGSGTGGTILINSPQVLVNGLGTSITASTLRPFADLAVMLKIVHPNDSDLTVRLDSPDGTRVALVSRVGGSGDNFTGTIFDDQATQPIASAVAPFTGTFMPREPLAQLIDQNVAGTWKLNISDQVAGNSGVPQNLESWSLRVGDHMFQSTNIPRAIPDNGSVSSNLVIAGPASAVIQGVGEAPGVGGDITINAGTVTVQNGATLSATTRGSGHGGTVNVNTTGLVFLTGPGAGLFTNSEASGGSGNINVAASHMTMDNGARVSAASSGTGDAGNIIITAPGNTVSLASDSSITSSTTGAGNAGQVIVTTPTLNLDNASLATSTSSAGNAGGITAKVGTLSLTGGAQITGASTGTASGAAGSVTIQGLASPADAVTLTNSSLRTSADSTGRGGSITVDATNLTLNGATISASVKDVNAGDNPTSGIGNITLTSSTMNVTDSTVTAETSGARNAGTLSLNAASINVANGTLTTSTSGTGNAGAITTTVGTMNLTNGSNVSSNSTGTLSDAGAAGNVTIKASGSFMSNGSKMSTSAENAKGGDILIDSQNMQLSDGTSISASSNAPFSETGEGNAGNITIKSVSNVVMQNSSVTTEASAASGGNIAIDAPDAMMVQLVNSRVSTSVGGVADKSDGGNITIDPQFVVLQNSQILAQAFAGAGGAINITATSAFIADPLSIVDASSTKGINGTVDIQSPLQNIGGQLTPLSQQFSSAAALLAQRCAARAADGKFSTFVVAAREGLPGEPGGYLASPSLTAELLGSSLSGLNPQTQLSAVTSLFPKYDARPIQLARFGEACHRQ